MLFHSKKKPPLTREQFNNPRFSIGEHTYGSPEIKSFNDGTRLSIGKFCSIASKVTILLGGNHRTDWGSTYPFPDLTERWPEAEGISGHPQTNGDLSIGNDVWIGYGATILSGLQIGSGAVIGACSVVTGDVAPYAIVAGNPARLIRKRFPPELCNRLLEHAWWDLPIDTIRKNIDIICSPQIDKLLQITP